MSAYRIGLIALVVSVVSLSVMSCRMNANYCKGRNRDNNCSEPPYDAMSDASCPDEITCSGATPVCNTDTHQCVECTTGHQEACTGETPACGTDNTCQKCSAHSQCPSSNVCLPSGACAATNEVAYVDPGYNGTSCIKDNPCPLLSTALSNTNKTNIKISGNITESSPVVFNSRNATLFSDPGSIISGPSSRGSVIKVDGTSKLEVYDLTISNGPDAGIGMASGNGATVSLHRVTVTTNSGEGISADGGTLNIDRSIITGNTDGGIVMKSATTYHIVNNFIVRNGSSSSDVGGVQAKPLGDSKLEFNTIVENNANGVTPGGIICSQTNVAVPRNLIFDNGSIAQTSIGCQPGDSMTTNPGANFKSGTDFHLTANTPAGPGGIRDVITCSTTDGFVDIDGEKRPRNGTCDLGADEY